MVNAFWLDRDLSRVVRWLVDRHVTSSVFECSMVLTTAAQVRGYPPEDDLYDTHRDHPLTRWACESYANWRRLSELVERAHGEWRYRWDHGPGEVHGSWATVLSMDEDALADLSWPADDRSDPPQVTGRWHAADYVDAYRLYYANEKRHLFSWTGRDRPAWLEKYAVPADEPVPPRFDAERAPDDGES